MKLAIIADSHDSLPAIDEALRRLKDFGIETIVHCGDVAWPDTLDHLSKNFSGQMHLALGNNDYGLGDYIEEKKYKNVICYGKTGEMIWQNLKIAFCHYPAPAKILAQSGKYDLVFYGHTHKPWAEKIKDCFLINPGTLSGVFAKPTFAVYDSQSKKLTLEILFT